MGAGSWWPEAPGPAGEVTAAGQADIWVPRGNEEVEDSVVGANWGLNKYLQTTGKPLGHLKGSGRGFGKGPGPSGTERAGRRLGPGFCTGISRAS